MWPNLTWRLNTLNADITELYLSATFFSALCSDVFSCGALYRIKLPHHFLAILRTYLSRSVSDVLIHDLSSSFDSIIKRGCSLCAIFVGFDIVSSFCLQFAYISLQSRDDVLYKRWILTLLCNLHVSSNVCSMTGSMTVSREWLSKCSAIELSS